MRSSDEPVKSSGDASENVADFRGLLEALAAERVEYVLIGGVAASIHGSARVTQDLDIVYARTPENLERLERSLAAHAPYLRGAPPGLPFRVDAATLRAGLNFTLVTELGDLDLLGEVAGGGTYEELVPRSDTVEILGLPVRCVDLETLIRLKKAAGRPKDLEAIAELEAIREELERDAGG
jgi:predicted nucleotidyltransferase